jgi:hypothetical protein
MFSAIDVIGATVVTTIFFTAPGAGSSCRPHAAMETASMRARKVVGFTVFILALSDF